jgi:hypothetical protein
LRNLRKTARPIPRKVSVNEYAQTVCFTQKFIADLGPDLFFYERLRSFVGPGGITMELKQIVGGSWTTTR